MNTGPVPGGANCLSEFGTNRTSRVRKRLSLVSKIAQATRPNLVTIEGGYPAPRRASLPPRAVTIGINAYHLACRGNDEGQQTAGCPVSGLTVPPHNSRRAVMKHLIIPLLLIGGFVALTTTEASAVVCAAGVYRAGCVAARPVVVAPRAVVVAPRAVVVAPRRAVVAPVRRRVY
jgi:hypothetical protein